MKRLRLETKVLASILLVAIAVNSRAQIIVIDDLGNEIELPNPAQRIVSLAPHITETLFAAGAGDKLVATVQYSDYPPAASEIPVIGSFNEISYETLVRMNPDLVITWASGTGEDVVARIQSLGFVVYQDEPKRLRDIASSLEHFGILAGTSYIASMAAENFLNRLEALGTSNDSESKVRVFYEIWNEPLTTLNGNHLISDIIELCGGLNIFSDAIPIAPVVSTESVLSADPQLIVVSGMDEERPEWLDEWAQWPGLAATEAGHLRFIPPDLLQRSTPRVIEGAEMMCDYISQARTGY